MFDIGFSELLVIAIVALVVLGPERLPKATRFAGLWVRRARAQWYSVKDELERELAAEELKRSLKDTQAAMRSAEQNIRDSGAEVRRDIDTLKQSVEADGSAQASNVEDSASATPAPSAQVERGDDAATDAAEQVDHGNHATQDAPRHG